MMLRSVIFRFTHRENHDGNGGGGISAEPWRKKTRDEYVYEATNVVLMGIPLAFIALWAYVIVRTAVAE